MSTCDGEIVRIEIERAHMEEDTGKSLHVGGLTGRISGAEYSLLDYNRAGVPLVEIVTKMVTGTKASAPAVAKAYVAALRDLLKSLGVSDVRMDQGSLRCDANLSLTPAGSPILGTRTETKNVNSLRSVDRAVRYEITRQAARLAAGGVIKQETRHFDESTGTTASGPVQGDRGGLPVFPRTGPGADRARAGVGRGDSCRAAGVPLAAAQSAANRLGHHRYGDARPGCRRCGRVGRGDGRRGCVTGGGQVLVGVLPRAAGEHPRGAAR